MTANGWSPLPLLLRLPPLGLRPAPALPPANDDFATLPLCVHIFSRVVVQVQEENLRQAGDEEVVGFKHLRHRLAC